jgi:hypothetical protein
MRSLSGYMGSKVSVDSTQSANSASNQLREVSCQGENKCIMLLSCITSPASNFSSTSISVGLPKN